MASANHFVADRVRELLAKCLDVDPEKVTPSARLVDDLRADSLDNIELCMDAEEEFDVQITDEEAENIVTVADAVALIECKLAEVA